MSITYSYIIKSTEPKLGIMEVEYSAEGYDTITVGIPLPLVDQKAEDLIKLYAPIGHWENSKKQFANVAVGTSGTIDHTTEVKMITPPVLTVAEIQELVASLASK